jgi:tetratricopeptide (TPR) repeat protein
MHGTPAWDPYPHMHQHLFDGASLPSQWLRLHAGDQEPLPHDPDILEAWVLYHRGEFEAAFQAGRMLGHAGYSVMNKASLIQADYLEASEAARLKLYFDTAERARSHIAAEPHNPNAHYFYGYALGRYSQGTSVAKALAQGYGEKIRSAFESAIALQPRHADAHLALGTFHAEVIDKVGALIGHMTYGAKRETALHHFRTGVALIPQAAIALTEYARGLMMLDAEANEAESLRLYEQAAAVQPMDAMEHLGVLQAQAELAL